MGRRRTPPDLRRQASVEVVVPMAVRPGDVVVVVSDVDRDWSGLRRHVGERKAHLTVVTVSGAWRGAVSDDLVSVSGRASPFDVAARRASRRALRDADVVVVVGVVDGTHVLAGIADRVMHRSTVVAVASGCWMRRPGPAAEYGPLADLRVLFW